MTEYGNLIDDYNHEEDVREYVKKMTSQHVASYSVLQDAYHVETVEDMCKTNSKIIFQNGTTDFAVFYVGYYKDCLSAIEKMKKYREKISL